jgi:hypothetical protein
MIARTAPAAAPARTFAAVFCICVLTAEPFLALPLVPPFLLADCLLADALLLAFFADIPFLLKVMDFERHRCGVVRWASGDAFAPDRVRNAYATVLS